HAEPRLLIGRSGRALGELLLRRLADHHLKILRLALAPDAHGRRLARAHVADGERQLRRALDLLAIEGDDDVARAYAGLLRRAVGRDCGHQRALRAFEPEGFGEGLVEL